MKTRRINRKEKMLLEDEKLILFKVAEDQLQVRIYNSKGNNVKNLIEDTFNRLDIESLMPKFIKRKKVAVKEFLRHAQSIDPLDKIKARQMLKKDRELDVWSYSDETGFKLELEKLCEEFKMGRSN